MTMNDKPVPASIECQSETDKDLVRTYYGDLGSFYRVRAALAATPAVGGEREALEAARQEIVLAIAFIGRDSRTDRLPKTLDGLVARLVKADQAIRAILAPPASPLRATDNSGDK